MESLKIFRLFWGDNRVFSAGGMGGVPPPLAKSLVIPPQSPFVDSSTKGSFPPTLINNFHVITQ